MEHERNMFATLIAEGERHGKKWHDIVKSLSDQTSDTCMPQLHIYI
jgi:hypothetical protein